MFLPMSTSPVPRSLMRICCIWDEPTLSAPTMRILLYSLRKLCRGQLRAARSAAQTISFSKYLLFHAALSVRTILG